MNRADHDIRLNGDQLDGLFTAVAVGQHFAVGVDETDPAHATGVATLLEGAGGLWHACGDGFNATDLADLAATTKAAKVMLGQCGKPQGSHKGECGYSFRTAAAVLPGIPPMPRATLLATFQHAVSGQRFAMVLGARGAEDRHILLCLLVERAGTLRPMARFASEWIDDLVDTTAEILGRLPESAAQVPAGG
jgi:hypothetical protein